MLPKNIISDLSLPFVLGTSLPIRDNGDNMRSSFEYNGTLYDIGFVAKHHHEKRLDSPYIYSLFQ